MADEQDAALVNQGLTRLLGMACLADAKENPRLPRFERAIQARLWWSGGGRRWLDSFVRSDEEVILPPDVLPLLTLDTHPRHPLAPLLCPIADRSCGRETSGWALRAEERWQSLVDERFELNMERLDSCRSDAQRLPPSRRYLRWRSCIEMLRPIRNALPIGSFRAPLRGWFVLRGKRHEGPETCDTVRVYGLGTGSAYVASICYRRQSSRSVAPVHTLAGAVPVDTLREAAWMTMLAAHVVSQVQPRAEVLFLPPRVARAPIDTVRDVVFVHIGSVGDGGTSLAWAWIDRGPITTGTLQWPYSDRPGEDYAAHLWRVVEAPLRAGCAPESLPPDLDIGGQIDSRLVKALRSMAPPACVAP